MIEKNSIFISYKHDDFPFVRQLYSRLEEMRPRDHIWYDKRGIIGGDIWWETILNEISACDIFIYVLSNESVRSKYCQAEFREALRLQKRIITVQARDRTTLTDELSDIQYIDMKDGPNDAEAIARLSGAITHQLRQVKRDITPLSPYRTPKPVDDEVPKRPPDIIDVDTPDLGYPTFETQSVGISSWRIMVFYGIVLVILLVAFLQILAPNLFSISPLFSSNISNSTSSITLTATSTPSSTDSPSNTLTVTAMYTATSTASQTDTPTSTATSPQPTLPPGIQNETFSVLNDGRILVFVCISHDGGHSLLEVYTTEPIGLMFSQTVNAIVYSIPAVALSTDVIHVLPDTASGTYRWVETVVDNANTTSDIPQQDSCESIYPDRLAGMNYTIQLPLSTNQALIIQPYGTGIQYDSFTGNLMNDAMGFVFREIPENGFPNFQILRLSGGADDTISISLPDFDQDVEFYVVSRQRLSYTRTDADGFESVSKFIDGRDRFLNRLDASGRTLIESIMVPGNFRFYVEFGEEIIYDSHGLLNFTRLGSYIPRNFITGTAIRPIDCGIGNPFNVPFYRADDYSQYLYLQVPLYRNFIVGVSTCDNEITIDSVRQDGILVVNDNQGGGMYYIAAWLVEPIP